MPNAFKLSKKQLSAKTAVLCLANDGDSNERSGWPVIAQWFPNYERFWRVAVVPLTKRIELPLNDARRYEQRDHISEEVWRISYLNYSLFLHFLQAADHLRLPLASSFGDFYTHLGSVCDLAEDFLLAGYLLTSECRGTTIPLLQSLSKKEFLSLATDWYIRNYEKAYEHYHRKGKGKSLHLPPRQALLDEYFGGDEPGWSINRSPPRLEPIQ